MVEAASASDREDAWEASSDPDLMRAIGDRQMGAFDALYDRYHRLVFSTAVRVLSDAAAAEDVVQDVFVRLWQRPERYVESRGNFVGWLLSVTRNRSIDEIRSRRRRPLTESQLGGRDPDDAGWSSDDLPSETAGREMERAEIGDQRAMVRAALADLPEEQRLAIELAYYRGLTQTEIAETLNAPLGTIKTRVRLGMQKLRTALDGHVGMIDPLDPPVEPLR